MLLLTPCRCVLGLYHSCGGCCPSAVIWSQHTCHDHSPVSPGSIFQHWWRENKSAVVQTSQTYCLVSDAIQSVNIITSFPWDSLTMTRYLTLSMAHWFWLSYQFCWLSVTHTVKNTISAYCVDVCKSPCIYRHMFTWVQCAAKEAGWTKLQWWRGEGEDEQGLSFSAYLAIERCTCCGCQVAERFTSSAQLPCWSDF